MNAIARRTWSTVIAWPVFALIALSPVLVWLTTVPDPMRYLRVDGLPAGQSLYVIAKLMGLLAICLFWLQCVLALARHAPLFAGVPHSDRRLHVRLGLATVALILLHVGLFVTAASLRTGHLAWDLLLPNVGHGYYRTSVGLGAAALWMCLLAVFAGRRVARGQGKWKPIHMLWPLVFGLVFVHAITIGTESRYGAMRYVVWFIAASLAVALAKRLYLLWKGSRHLSRDPKHSSI
jgi:predicted ferric reductase